MKKSHRKLGYLAIIVVLLISSCTEDLTIAPISQISVESFWKTEDDAKAALNGMYVRLRQLTEGLNATLFMLGEARSQVL